MSFLPGYLQMRCLWLLAQAAESSLSSCLRLRPASASLQGLLQAWCMAGVRWVLLERPLPPSTWRGCCVPCMPSVPCPCHPPSMEPPAQVHPLVVALPAQHHCSCMLLGAVDLQEH